MRRSRPGRSPRPSVARAGAPGSRRSARTGCGTRPRARWSGPGCRSCGSGRCCATAACRAPRSTRAWTSSSSGGSPHRGREVTAMSALSEHVDEYLRARRALGVKLERHGRLLPQLVVYLEAAGASTITRELAIAWARLARRRAPAALGGQAVDRARVRRLPANDRPEHRDPAGRGVRRPLPAPDPVPVVPAGHRSAARGRARAAPAAEGGQLRGAVRTARRDRHAPR